MREKCRTVPRLTLLGLPWKLSGLTLTKGVSAVCLTNGRNHCKLVRCFYDFGFAWNSDPSPVLFSWTWLFVQQPPARWAFSSSKVTICSWLFYRCDAWGEKTHHNRVEWQGGEAWVLSCKTPTPPTTATFLRKWEKFMNLLSCCICAQFEQHFCSCSQKVGCPHR